MAARSSRSKSAAKVRRKPGQATGGRAAARRRAGVKTKASAKAKAKPKPRTKKGAGKAVRKPSAAPARRAGPTAEQMVELVARYVAAFNRGDVDGIVGFYHPRGVMEDPVGHAPAKGHRAIGAVYAGGFRQGVTIALEGPVRCAVGALAFPVVARTPSARLWSVNVFELAEDGKILRMRAYWGPSNVEGAIGVRG